MAIYRQENSKNKPVRMAYVAFAVIEISMVSALTILAI